MQDQDRDPVMRGPKSSDVFNAAVALVHDQASAMNGQAINFTGRQVIR
jgi:hypothetical protein